MRKNVAGQVASAQLVSASDGSAFTGSVTAYVTGDNGTQAVGSVGSGACTHKGNGYHTYAISQAETNYDLVAVTFTGTGAVPVTIQYATTPATGILAPTVADRTLDVTATGAAGIDWGNVENQATSVDLSATAINLCDTVTVNSDMRGTDSASTHSAADVWSVATRVLTAGTNIGFPTVGQIADAVWDEPGADHLTTGTTGEAQYFTDFNVSALPNASANATAVWAAATRTLTAGTNIGFPTTAQIADAVLDEAVADHNGVGSLGAQIGNVITGAVVTTIPGLIANLPTDADVNAQCDTAISDYFGTAGSSLTAIPWNASWDAEVQSECVDALNSLFTFTVSGQVDANIQRINDTAIVGNGVSPKFGV